MSTWDALDREQWRSIVIHKSLPGEEMFREGFLSAIDKIQHFEDLLRRHQLFVKAVVEKSDRGICPVCSYLWSECDCGVNATEYNEPPRVPHLCKQCGVEVFTNDSGQTWWDADSGLTTCAHGPQVAHLPAGFDISERGEQ